MLLVLKNNHELIVALFALLVSCIAIYQTGAGLRMQREHNYRSVRPIAAIRAQNFEDRIGVLLENRGLGPMRIEKLVVMKGDREIGSNLVDIVPELSGKRLWTNFWRGLCGLVMQPGAIIELLLLEGDLSDPIYVENRDTIRDALSNLRIKVIYSDIYENSFKESESLSCFNVGEHDRTV